MTPTELTTARKALGLNMANLGRALELTGPDPGRLVRMWEDGKHRIPGPAAVAVRLMLQVAARSSLQEAVDEARAILTPADPPPPVLEALEGVGAAVQVRTRRRG